MKKITKILIILIFIPSLCNGSVIGRGLICKKEGDKDNFYNHPYYMYFSEKNFLESYNILGYEIKTVKRDYILLGTNKIWIDKFGTLNRETLKLKTHSNNFVFLCKGYNSKEDVIDNVKKFIEIGKSKNKF